MLKPWTTQENSIFMLIVEGIRYQQESDSTERDQIIPDNGLSGDCHKVLVELAESWGSPSSPGATSGASRCFIEWRSEAEQGHWVIYQHVGS